jgi:Predicted signal transduction protein with a C-terminal ATPase domain
MVFVLGVQYRRQAIEDIHKQLTYEDNIIAQSVEARIQNAQSSVNTIIINLNEELGAADLNNNGGPTVNINTQRKIYTCMVNTFTTFNRAEQVMVIWNNGVFWYENWVENYVMKENGANILNELNKLGVDRSGRWIMRLSSNLNMNSKGPYFVKQFVDIKTQKPLGYVILKPNNTFGAIDSNSTSRNRYLFNPEKYLVNCSDDDVMRKYTALLTTETGKNYSDTLYHQLMQYSSDRSYNMNTVTLSKNWSLISVTDMQQETKKLNQTLVLLLLFSMVIAVVMFFILDYFVARIVSPIQKLSNHMVDLPGELPSPIDLPESNDEVGVLVSHFNEMAESNRKLVCTLTEEKKQQEYLKFQLLQSQIKPHFLYNSLDTIYCLSVMQQNEKASIMTKLLSDYYRHVLSKGMDWVLLYEEIQQTENYLKIQTIRYESMIDYEIHINNDVDNIKIPKLTVQPLVENAIYHGIKPLGRKGHLQLMVSQTNNILEIKVIDDGIGMSEIKFEEEISKKHNNESGFGLYNVIERLKFYYGDRCNVILQERMPGTCITICIRLDHEVI